MPDDAAGIPSLAKFIQTVMPLILEAVDPHRTIAMLEAIVENDRWNSFDRWHETSQRLQSAYEACGGARRSRAFQRVANAAPADGSSPKRPTSWRRRSILSNRPRGVWPSYRDCPWHVVQWLAATPAEGLRCELVAVDSAEQLASAPPGSLAGKMILTRLDPWANRENFCDAGAAGIVCDIPVNGCPDAVAWTKFGWGGLDFWNDAPRAGWLFDFGHRRRFAAIAVAAGGPRLVVEAKLDIRRYSGMHDVVSATILGREDPDAEIWAVR